MTKAIVKDKVDIKGTRIRDDGYLVVDARIARTGIQEYLGSELGIADKKIIKVYRPDTEVFNDKAMASFAHRPVTSDHPSKRVTSDNWKDVAVGQTADEVKRDGQYLRVPLMVSDGDTINQIQNGKRELSAGYKCNLKFEKGTLETGETYDAIQTDIRANHVAVVSRGRAGKECRIGDGSDIDEFNYTVTVDEGNKQMNLRKIMVDGLEIETTDQGAQAINKLNNQLDVKNKELEEKEEKKKKEMAEKDAVIAKKDAEIDSLKEKVLDQGAIDKLVADRSALETTVFKLCGKDVDPKGLSDADLRKVVVAKLKGDDAVNDRSQAYIDARFDILAEDVDKGKSDNFRDAMKGNKSTNNSNIFAERNAAFNDLIQFDATGEDLEKN